MHLDEEQLQRLLDGELADSEEASARAHIAQCADCRRRAADAEREEDEVDALLGQLDGPAPSLDAESVAARARARDSGWMRRAAAVLLAVGIAGAAYAVPGSPLPALVQAVVTWIGGGPDVPRKTPEPERAPHAGSPDASVAGIAVDPGERLLILFTSSQAEGEARVTLTDGALVTVRAPIGAATFSSDVDRLVIDNHGSAATFEIQIPRTAPLVEIRAKGDRLFVKEGARVTPEGPAGSGGPFLLPLSHR